MPCPVCLHFSHHSDQWECLLRLHNCLYRGLTTPFTSRLHIAVVSHGWAVPALQQPSPDISTSACPACSFAIVIQQLPQELRIPICVFYLVLRALDTVEDDMALTVPFKVPVLKSFHEKISDK